MAENGLGALIDAFGGDLPECCQSLTFWRDMCAGIAAKGRTYTVPERAGKPRVAQPPPAVNETSVLNRKDAA